MLLTAIAESVGKGLFAGLAGTAAMTVSSTIEMVLRGRPPSSAPAEAASKVLGIQPTDEHAKQRFANLVHWAYGTGWGSVRGLLGLAGLSGPPAILAHFAAIWGAALIMLPRLGVAPPISEWGAIELAIDAFHHSVYATAAGLVYDFLDQ